MRSFLARWRPGQVFAAWCVYWVGLAGVTLTPTILAILRVSHAPKDTASVGASFENSVISITVKELGKVTHVASATTLEVALWVGVPPLVLYGIWMATRARRGAPVSALGEGPLEAPRAGVPQGEASPSPHSRAPHA